MTAAKKAAAKPAAKPEIVDEQPDEVHVRGGWDVGYRGERVDDADDDAYTVTGVLKATKSGDE
jgi:hypothetical protein